MATRIRAGGKTYELVRRGAASPGFDREMRFAGVHGAQSFLRRINADDARALRRALAEDARADEAEADLLDKLSRALSDGRMRVFERPRPDVGGLRAAEADPVETSFEQSWIEVELIDDEDGAPVPDVKVALTAPGKDRKEAPTNGGGVIEVRPCKPGSGLFESVLAGAYIGDTLEFMGAGVASETPLRGRPFPRTKGKPWSLARIVRHPVRTGETLDSIAKANGMTWQALARFNFDTQEPKKINDALRDQVGCTRRTKSDKNYVFDSHDVPGILYVPKPVLVSGLPTGDRHVLCGRRVERPMRFFLFSN